MSGGGRRWGLGSWNATPVLAVLLLVLHPLLPPPGRGDGAAGIRAQSGPDARGRESRVLREAAGREAAGDAAGAEVLLRAYLEEEPGATGTLFALERVLRNQDRLDALIPVVERAIAVGAGSSGVRYLKLRLLVETDRRDEVRGEIDQWLAAEPSSPDPYREGARALERAEGPDAAVALLDRGREVLDLPALDLDAGDVFLRAGDGAAAARRWARGLGEDAVQFPTLLRRLQGLPGEERREVAGALINALETPPTTIPRLRAGISAALEAGLSVEAQRLSEQALAGSRGAARNTFLTQLARDAGAAGEGPLSLWALESQRAEASPPEVRALDGEIARVALTTGDTATALRARNREADAWPRGSDERRQALAEAIRLEAATATSGVVRPRVDAFRAEYPGANDVDEVASILARTLVDQGDSAAARQVLDQMSGPAAARERALLTLTGPDPRAAREDLLAAASGLPAVEATEWLQLVSLLEGLGREGGRLAASATLLQYEGDPAGAVALISSGVSDLGERERPPLLALGARMAEAAGDDESAAVLRERILTDHPEALETAEATLSLARWKASRPEGIAEAITLLETFILGRPTSPAVPEARRALTRLQQRARTGGAG